MQRLFYVTFECAVPSRSFPVIDTGPISSLLTQLHSGLPISCFSETHSPRSNHSKIFNINWIISLPLKLFNTFSCYIIGKMNILNVLNKSLDDLVPAPEASAPVAEVLCISHSLSVSITNTPTSFPTHGLRTSCFFLPSEP